MRQLALVRGRTEIRAADRHQRRTAQFRSTVKGRESRWLAETGTNQAIGSNPEAMSVLIPRLCTAGQHG